MKQILNVCLFTVKQYNCNSLNAFFLQSDCSVFTKKAWKCNVCRGQEKKQKEQENNTKVHHKYKYESYQKYTYMYISYSPKQGIMTFSLNHFNKIVIHLTLKKNDL